MSGDRVAGLSGNDFRRRLLRARRWRRNGRYRRLRRSRFGRVRSRGGRIDIFLRKKRRYLLQNPLAFRGGESVIDEDIVYQAADPNGRRYGAFELEDGTHAPEHALELDAVAAEARRIVGADRDFDLALAPVPMIGDPRR